MRPSRQPAGDGERSAQGLGAELLRTIEQIGREKRIDPAVLISALEDAMTAASRKQQERSPARGAEAPAAAENLISRLDRKTGKIQLFARKMVVERVEDPTLELLLEEARSTDPATALGAYVDLPRSTTGLGRVEAQAAKQVILQSLREAERELVFREYCGRVGEMINATVKHFERGDIFLELGGVEAVLPRRYQSRTDMFSQGDRVRAVIVEVNKSPKGSQIVVSRIDPYVLVKLFEMEVPEIYDGTVSLHHAVREAGERSKVAVSSRQRDVDPVGACVGMKGARVQAITRELRGERIEIVQWQEDPARFAAEALKPARVSGVRPLAEDPGALEVQVDEDQLSLAIGKRGQNVRLAARLVGRRIEIQDHRAPAAGDEAVAGRPEVTR